MINSNAFRVVKRIEEQLPKWRKWFPNEESIVEIPRCDLLLLIGEIRRLDDIVRASEQPEWEED